MRVTIYPMIKNMYPFFCAMLSAVLAQALKPLCYYINHHEWRWSLVKASGGFPSSHSALVSALALSVGIQEHFSSTIFAVTCAMAVIVIYDAANVRYYSGQNIKITQQLIKDVQTKSDVKLEDPIYKIKLKDVLGHKWTECAGGIILGALIALIFHFGMKA